MSEAEELDDSYDARLRLGQTSCLKNLDGLMYCFTPVNQLSAYYNTGKPDGCMRELSNYYRCMKLKMNYSVVEKTKLLEEIADDTFDSKEIWTLRKTPEEGQKAAHWPHDVPVGIVE